MPNFKMSIVPIGNSIMLSIQSLDIITKEIIKVEINAIRHRG
jgi:hypothetical protein